jgi:aerobic C4-dicarboxylate transport protein
MAKYGIGRVINPAALVGTFYLTSAIFILRVLGLIARLNGFSILRLIAYLRSELLLVLGTSSSESALPNLMKKLENAGCTKAVVGLVVPTGYSFNLDGTNIYMTLAALFIAQATGVDLSLGDQILLLLVAAISSKGAAAVATIVVARWENELDHAMLEAALHGRVKETVLSQPRADQTNNP